MWRRCCGCLAIALALSGPASAQVYENDLPLDHDAIRYWETPAKNRVSLLVERVERSEAELEFRPSGFGYLASLLEALEIDDASQTLVFSKTSLQRSRISPRQPRAKRSQDGWRLLRDIRVDHNRKWGLPVQPAHGRFPCRRRFCLE